jgi:hypothetical protein
VSKSRGVDRRLFGEGAEQVGSAMSVVGARTVGGSGVRFGREWTTVEAVAQQQRTGKLQPQARRR